MENIQRVMHQARDRVRQDAARRTASGEDFNIYRIAKIERAEVNTHSAMIAELLNPKGTHGIGPLFLQLMLVQMDISHGCSLSEASVRKEQSFPYGRGRVDIAIHLRNHLILIENKIDAQDGPEQLKQYAEIGEASGKDWHLWYLTTTGIAASKESHCGKTYRPISYSEHILNWLEQCVTHSADKPALQQALIQYRNLVRTITGKTMAQTTREALIALLSTGDDLKAADAISEALPYAKGAMLFRFFQKVQDGVEGIEDKRSRVAPPKGFAGLDATLENCNKWFMPKGQKVKNVGMFFNIGREDLLFRVEVASEALHFGVVPVKDGALSKIERPDEYLSRLPQNLHHRNWRAFQWFSCLHQNYVAQNMVCLRDLSQLLDDIRQTLKQL
ncbi:PD-(D/E)XK nuclease family protein [Stutzerimonas stutzeri]|uniref:PDDEXK-like family protein n=1 Tax=Stutzerimonas stutzeri TaxID=316 RepID=UPI00210E05EC|nr:PD-(D/E)XK nuclease family protein [Stutzerimonas stutzeri]MCQ4256499.1 PD-(D/E)XK nuclease family protein [Stutzerimonas stutzeri]